MDDKRIQQLAMTAAALIQVFTEMWETYELLFKELDMDDETVVARSYEAVAELEHNLVDTLDTIQAQLFQMSGVNEALPADSDIDLESSVLRVLENIDDFDIESLRTPEATATDFTQHVQDWGNGIELEDLTRDELIDKVLDMRSILDDMEEWSDSHE